MIRFFTTTPNLRIDPKTTGLVDVVTGQTGLSVPGSDLMQEVPEEEELQSRPSPVDSFDFKASGVDIGGGLFEGMEDEETIQMRPADFETLAICPEDPLGPLAGLGCNPIDPFGPLDAMA